MAKRIKPDEMMSVDCHLPEELEMVIRNDDGKTLKQWLEMNDPTDIAGLILDLIFENNCESCLATIVVDDRVHMDVERARDMPDMCRVLMYGGLLTVDDMQEFGGAVWQMYATTMLESVPQYSGYCGMRNSYCISCKTEYALWGAKCGHVIYCAGCCYYAVFDSENSSQCYFCGEPIHPPLFRLGRRRECEGEDLPLPKCDDLI